MNEFEADTSSTARQGCDHGSTHHWPCVCLKVRTHFSKAGMLSLAPSHQDTLGYESGSGQKQL